jgi:putative ABC transport system ATP-binding protein
MEMLALGAEGLTARYGSRTVFSDCSFELECGQSLGIVGPSGAGKSTLLWALAGLKRPTAGVVRVGSRDLYGMGRRGQLRLRRRTIGLVVQHGDLIPDLTLVENVSLPLRLNGVPASTAFDAAMLLLDRLGIDSLGRCFPDEVSGGERQRAAVARAVIHRPAVVLADEPTGSLDEANATLVTTCLFELTRDQGSALVVVTHATELAARADHVVRLDDGALVTVPS